MATDLEAGNNWLADYIPYQIYRVSSRMTARLRKRLQALKINTSEWRALSVMRSYGTLSITQLTDLALMEQPTISRVVLKLEKDGHVVRRASAQDSRVTEVTLTQSGADILAEMAAAAMRHQEHAFHGFTEQELLQLRTTLARINKNLDALE
ncbi:MULTISPECIES: MarR family winged helix-turn-helix transcriptional regulator [unclassified Sphingomonas]|uniref:MarR family winged helix-turn-helix transcriptional regulator n=1 Tax=unclassified Sphingomonas TaxID=196159 RepID=UPI000700B70E|nr:MULTISPECIES: MarR family transcriptional regulator [unclassified Sphingomonas]KQX25104.1 hypothetical protein ASD17_23835 [Sphingomonas sp. Root1294]KQY66121.1 hypothetical protein ASD39_13635 [Sphingomonas sp. Root50]KRB89713.1 hypothetical protein ASE22_18960 [Sphingomonas sp. Root720]